MINILLNSLGYCANETLPNRSLTYKTLVDALVHTENLEEASNRLIISNSNLNKILAVISKKHFPDRPYKVRWDNFLLSYIEHKKCNYCKAILSYTYFTKCTSSWDSIDKTCIECKAKYKSEFTEKNPTYNSSNYIKNKSEYISRAIKYRTNRDKATPTWANLDKIKEVYINCPEGYHVDHIIPLQGELVSGLHVEGNLQYLKALDNIKKSNKFIPV